MRRFLLIFLLLFTACQVLAPLPAGTPEPTATASPDFRVIYHPDGPLYVGDQVSIEVLVPTGFEPKGQSMRVSLDGKTLGETGFQSFGIGLRQQATFYWVWDTSGLSDGSYSLAFSVLPDGIEWHEQVTLLPLSVVPYPEPDARWESVETRCCAIHYISGTDSARDIEKLKTMVETQAVDVEKRLGTQINGKIPITFLPRVLGHGGFASESISVSYLDHNYAGNAAAQVIHHEMVHWLDSQMGGKMRPTILIEGLAVFLSDGHFKVEPIFARAAALLELGWYIPLRDLSNAFYPAQHEIGYMEGGALAGYLIQAYGWERFNAFYRDISPADSGSQADALDKALLAHFNLTLAQLEQDFIAFLRKQPVDDSVRADMRLTVAFFDTVRRYQRTLDPSAYFLTAWLINDEKAMFERNIVADYLRHPQAEANRRVESLLISADAQLRAGNYLAVEATLRSANLLLDVWRR